jgi:hypothetical protein
VPRWWDGNSKFEQGIAGGPLVAGVEEQDKAWGKPGINLFFLQDRPESRSAFRLSREFERKVTIFLVVSPNRIILSLELPHFIQRRL